MIVVTGGAGFIGSNLLAALEARGNRALVVVDQLGHGDKWRNLAKRELYAIVPPADLFDWLTDHRSAVEMVFHMGAISTTTETDVDLILATNFTLSQKLWRWCADNRVRLIYASSAATYGDGSHGFEDSGASSDLATLRPLNAYGWSKHLFDRWAVRQVERGYPCPPQWAGLKFFNVYGPNEYHKAGQRSVAVQLHQQIRAGERVRLFRSYRDGVADGGQRRDFVWVGDAVDVMLWLADHPKVHGLFNVGSGWARSFLDLATAVYKTLGLEPAIDFIEMPPGLEAKYQYFTEARLHRLAQAGYPGRPTSLEEGVRLYLSDFLETADPYR